MKATQQIAIRLEDPEVKAAILEYPRAHHPGAIPADGEVRFVEITKHLNHSMDLVLQFPQEPR